MFGTTWYIEQHETNECAVHNERIERLWRDVFRCVLSLFHANGKREYTVLSK